MSKAKKIKPSNSLWEELCALPENVVGEIFNDELVVSPRPAPRHIRTSGVLFNQIYNSFDNNEGGWLILCEPQIHFEKPSQKIPKENVVVPDLAGWRRERLPKLPETAYFELPPDWICEVLSPSTARYDKISKMQIYALNGVLFYWLLDPLHKILEVLTLQNESYQRAVTFGENDKVSAPPFEAIEFELGILWDL